MNFSKRFLKDRLGFEGLDTKENDGLFRIAVVLAVLAVVLRWSFGGTRGATGKTR